MSVKSKFGKPILIITIFVVLMFVIIVIGVFFKFTNSFKDDFKNFYVKIDGRLYTDTHNNINLEYGKEYNFECKYLLDIKEDKNINFKVKVVPNKTDENNFNFSVDGEMISFLDVEDLTSAFDIYKNENGFILKLSEDFNITKCLDSVYVGKEVILPEGLFERDLYYTLIISSYNEKIVYYFNFGSSINLITLDKGVIKF